MAGSTATLSNAATATAAQVSLRFSRGCTEGHILTTHSNPTCQIRCKAGYSSTVGPMASRLTCASDAADGGATTGGLLLVGGSSTTPACTPVTVKAGASLGFVGMSAAEFADSPTIKVHEFKENMDIFNEGGTSCKSPRGGPVCLCL